MKIMKKLFVLIFAVLLFAFSYSQENNAYNIDLNVGTRIGAMHTANADLWEPAMADLSVGIGFRYMLFDHLENEFLSSLGLKVDFGYDQITTDYIGGESATFQATTSDLLRFTGHLFIDAGALFIESESFGLLAHGGTGLSFMSNNDDFTRDGTDRMVNLVFGVTPQYKLNENFSLGIDISLVMLGLQDRGVEMVNLLNDNPVWGNYLNASLSVTYGF